VLAPDARPAAAQLDLFVDGAAEAALLHDLGSALAAGHPESARKAVERLRSRDPTHPDLSALGRLCDATAPGLPAPTLGSALDALATEVDTVLLPAATRLLGGEGVAVLNPVWRRLVEGGADLRLDGPAGVGGVARYWVGVAHYHLGGHRQARRLWLSLAWLDPAVLASHAPRCPDERLRRAWEVFDRSADFESPDDAREGPRWFAAWLVLRHRELAGLVRPDEVPGADAPAGALRQVLSLLPLEGHGLSEVVIQGRRALQKVAPTFFPHYLRAVGR
jgi:hypothetical protein